ncbi:MAG: porin family protein [Hyphomicrobiales bacterium]|nr:MAG: porin family protein [Hyphomicrobiales bacterium]
MKRTLAAAAALTLMTAVSPAVRAADLDPVTFDWSGVYLGLNAGGAWNDSEVRSRVESLELGGIVAGELSERLAADDLAFTGGGLIGVNWQYESLVLGVETDFNYLGFSQSKQRDVLVDNGGNLDLPVSTGLKLESNWYGTIRARVGFAADNLLFYGTGGVAYGQIKASGYIDSDGVDGVGSWHGSVDDINWGWTLGAGMEYAFDDSWLVGAEYLFTDLGSASWRYSNDSELPDTNARGDADLQFNVLRMTVKYKF